MTAARPARRILVPRYGDDIDGPAELVVGPAHEPDDHGRGAGVDDAGAGSRALGDDAVRGVAAHGADDAPGEAGVLEDPLGKDVSLAADRRHDQLGLRRGRSGSGVRIRRADDRVVRGQRERSRAENPHESHDDRAWQERR